MTKKLPAGTYYFQVIVRNKKNILVKSNLAAVNVTNAFGSKIIVGTTSTTSTDYILSANIKGANLSNATLRTSVKVATSDLQAMGAYFLAGEVNGTFYFWTKDKKWIQSNANWTSYSGLVRLDPDGNQRTKITNSLTGDFVPAGGVKLYLCYGVGNSLDKASTEVKEFNNNSTRCSLVQEVAYSPDILSFGVQNNSKLSNTVKLNNIKLTAIIQPEYLESTEHQFYGKKGYRFIGLIHKGQAFLKNKNQQENILFSKLDNAVSTGLAFDGSDPIELRYFEKTIFNGNLSGFAGADLYAYYGVGTNESEAMQWALKNGKVVTLGKLPLAPATIMNVTLSETGKDISDIKIPHNGSATLKFKILDGKAAALECKDASDNWLGTGEVFDLTNIVDETQSREYRNLKSNYTCRLKVTGSDDTIQIKVLPQLTVSGAQ
jgi:hypothetical protein